MDVPLQISSALLAHSGGNSSRPSFQLDILIWQVVNVREGHCHHDDVRASKLSTRLGQNPANFGSSVGTKLAVLQRSEITSLAQVLGEDRSKHRLPSEYT